MSAGNEMSKNQMEYKMNRGYRIRKKYFSNMVAILLIALLLSSVCVLTYTRQNTASTIVESYVYMTEKMGLTMENLFQKTDEVTAECILYDGVQDSLLAEELTGEEQNSLSKYFAYINLDDAEEYCYADNKGNVYTRSYSKVTYHDFLESGLADTLGEDYAKTRWVWTEDYLFGDGEMALFIVRYVRSFEYAHEPGMLFLKMGDDFLKEIFGEEELSDAVSVGVMTADGELCASWVPEGYELAQEDLEQVATLSGKMSGTAQEEVTVFSEKMASGRYLIYRQADCGFTIFTFVPNSTLNSGLSQIQMVLVIIFVLTGFIAAVLSMFFARRFTRPIRYISDTMSGFDGNDFGHFLELHTNTELDQIGQSYNEMLHNIEQLLEDIRKQERELRKSEMNTLIAQINPHFLYNTLDTIYMLARMNREETTMQMIQALSRYLKLCLSKGSELVTVEDELDNVRSYMEIQQIRNKNLFQYEIECDIEVRRRLVLKLILQPLAENALHYGFGEIYEGGLIRITVGDDRGGLLLKVYNNGTPMREDMRRLLNRLTDLPITEMKNCFPDGQHGYGVVNIVTRLRLQYGEGVGFAYETDESGTCCVMRLPGASE
ncbi:MAG: sensor histidine kinase [Lachnospiraceae bacterium]|nr:sensor histidine kinase [Lachnospiraceae bacterium]